MTGAELKMGNIGVFCSLSFFLLFVDIEIIPAKNCPIVNLKIVEILKIIVRFRSIQLIVIVWGIDILFQFSCILNFFGIFIPEVKEMHSFHLLNQPFHS